MSTEEEEELEGPASPDQEDEDLESPDSSPRHPHPSSRKRSHSPFKDEDPLDEGSSGSSPDAASSSFVPHKKFRRFTHTSSAGLIPSPTKTPTGSNTHNSPSPENLSDSPSSPPDEDNRSSFRSSFDNTATTGSPVEDSPATEALTQKFEYHPPESADKSSIGWKLMGKAGYKEGKGLGKASQGRVEPVGLSTQRGRRGLGAEQPKGLEQDFEAKWNKDKEIISVEEYPEWMPSGSSMDPPTSDELASWMKTGPKKLTIDDETEFCSPECVRQVLKAKSVFDELLDRDLRNARTRANPFETIKGAFFQNRAAMKTANIDAVFDWMLTNPTDPLQTGEERETETRREWVPETSPDLYYFADVCAGPGGFTEYMLWKKGWNAHGFGFTLRGQNDFKLDNFLAASSEMFEPFYGVNGLEGDGDVMKPSNLRAFEKFVKDTTKDGKGVHLFMADGGFSVEGQENIQEILSKRLYLCQFLCGLTVLRPGGNFFCKLFDVFTPFSAGLVYLMYRVFHRVSLHKPNTSRPANSERYIVCKGLRENSSIIREYMRAINDKLHELSQKPEADQAHADVIEVVPVDLMKDDTNFYDYLVDSNEKLAIRQSVYLDKYRVFAKNPNLLDTRQGNLREESLKYWHIPDLLRAQPPRPSPTNGFRDLCPQEGDTPPWLGGGGRRRLKFFVRKEQLQIPNNLSGVDFLCSVATQESPTVILALGKHLVFQWEGSRWDMLEGTQKQRFKLPRNTLITAEITYQYKGRGNGLQTTPLMRILDAHTLAGQNVSALRYPERMERVRKFCDAISKEHSRTDLGWIRPAEHWQLKNLQTSRFGIGKIKGAERVILYNREPKGASETVSSSVPYLTCKGLYLQRTVRDPWLVCKSRSQNLFYYNRPPDPSRGLKQQSIFESDWKDKDTGDLVVKYQDAQVNRLLWDWVNVKTAGWTVKELLIPETEDEETLSIRSVVDFVTDK